LNPAGILKHFYLTCLSYTKVELFSGSLTKSRGAGIKPVPLIRNLSGGIGAGLKFDARPWAIKIIKKANVFFQSADIMDGLQFHPFFSGMHGHQIHHFGGC